METKTMENEIIQSAAVESISPAQGQNKSQKQKNSKGVIASRVIVWVVLAIYTLWIFIPFLIILETSLVPKAEFRDATHYIWWPENPTFAGYIKLFTKDPYMVGGVPSLLRGFFNTMWITLIPLFSGLLQSALVAYVYARYNFPAKNTLFMITVTLMFIPLGAVGFTSYMFYQNIGWTNGNAAVLPMIVPGLFASAGTVFFLRPYIEGINKEIIEAAEIDGMGFWQVFFKIILPLSKPALIAQFIFGFVGGYNNYAGALIYLQRERELWTLQIAMQKIISHQSSGSDFGFTCATSLMAMLPLVILYIACQKFFIEGISFGGGKE